MSVHDLADVLCQAAGLTSQDLHTASTPSTTGSIARTWATLRSAVQTPLLRTTDRTPVVVNDKEPIAPVVGFVPPRREIGIYYCCIKLFSPIILYYLCCTTLLYCTVSHRDGPEVLPESIRIPERILQSEIFGVTITELQELYCNVMINLLNCMIVVYILYVINTTGIIK